MDWKSNFDERELKEVEFCLLYKRQFSHGAQGHNLRTIVAKMASILDNAESVVNQESEKPFPGPAIHDKEYYVQALHLAEAAVQNWDVIDNSLKTRTMNALKGVLRIANKEMVLSGAGPSTERVR